MTELPLGHFGVFLSPFVGFWLAGQLGTPPLITAFVVLWAASRYFEVTLYGGGGL